MHLISTDKFTPLAVHVPSFQVTLAVEHNKDLVLGAVALEKEDDFRAAKGRSVQRSSLTRKRMPMKML